ncbi:retron Ec67 family RNA-directed DNA polymerase/endonuclease [Paracoccus denitrificans]|uniref:retron Ec67 family RNA-directed DNA polymerase/endonuclease n=1 Tax=Paracoccus denitrificans TaxID=266 RepID=UPI001E32C4AE|nr:retron Ec67 family RNA-directed DNA polymerase/endonuclease [Paracoccus denitrificans]UFS67277.1 retron Ec67 family RNA-directed DNA polymerase/endonuclease [Paracoccus denitrificans]
MSSLDKLKKAQSLTELAKLLGFTPKGVSYVLYKLDPAKKYRSFEIPKKSGGVRTINAPEPQLALLQTRLAELLYACVHERKQENARFWFASHGFHQGRTIISNAEVHRRRRFVFNLDLEDFFGTINFGRVRGFFIRDAMFSLEPKLATIIAQIACHDNALPQGSPCSPVISNLIGNILDSRLLALARNTRCTYTRYADDLTFSTNEKLFPTEIAVNVHGPDWEVGAKLRKTIEGSGFSINPVKTRMSLRQSRQTVTGLVVNAKANINQDYYRAARAMCNSLFQTGYYFRPGDDPANATDKLGPLEGTLSHIYFVKARRDRHPKINKLAKAVGEFHPPRAPEELYRKFLFYKYFAAPAAPLIVTEGVSDITYLQCAIRALVKKFPLLAKEEDGKAVRIVHFLKSSGTSRELLNLGHGAAGQGALISQYENVLKKYKHKPMAHPVIILCDNDDGLKSVIKNAKSKIGKTVSTTTTDPFYHLGLNLYLVKVPEGTPPVDKDIESLFHPALLATVLDGKKFNPKKEHADHTEYGKVIFAEAVVRANAGTVDFSGFEGLLTRIEDVLKHYAALLAAAAVSGVAAGP